MLVLNVSHSLARIFSAVFALWLVAQLPAAELRFLAVTKGSLWTQTGVGAPVQQAGNAHEFRAYLELGRPNAVSSATLRWPTPVNATRSLTDRATVWEHHERYSSRTLLNNAHPNGTYTFITQTVLDGRRTNTVTASADGYPLAVRVANFVEAQGIDSRSDFTLRWDPAGTGANGFVQVRVLSGGTIVFQTPTYPQAVGALNGSAASVTIPRNTLAEGQVYQAQITIWRKVTDDLTGYPGVAAWGAYTQTTEFPLRTIYTLTDLHWFGFAKIQRHLQSSVNSPGVASDGPFEFLGFADPTATTNLNSGSIRTAAGALLGSLSDSAGAWRFAQRFGTQAELDGRFPNGVLNVQLETRHNGSRTQALALTGATWPAAPHINNFNEGSALDGTKPFVLRWNALAGGTAADFVQVRIRKGTNILARSADHPFAAGALNGTSTSFTVPASLLAPGESCEATILFLKSAATDTLTYPKVLGLCGYARETTVTLRARGGAGTPPELRNLKSLPGALEFEFAADTGRQYLLQGSSDFAQWADLLITNAPGPNFKLRVNQNAGLRRQFLRVTGN